MPTLLLLFACAPDTTPTWAYDPIWIEPAAEGTVTGFQTWQLYGPKWVERPKERFYACAVVTELTGDPIDCDAEPDCVSAWSMVSSVLETDCEDATLAENPLFITLQALALGGLAEGDVPHQGLTSVGYADYGDGWEVHGEAYPEALDYETSGGKPDSAAWDGVAPFLFVPLQSFAL